MGVLLQQPDRPADRVGYPLPSGMARGPQLQILAPVIHPDAVLVVDGFSLTKGTPQDFGHHQNVGKNLPGLVGIRMLGLEVVLVALLRKMTHPLGAPFLPPSQRISVPLLSLVVGVAQSVGIGHPDAPTDNAPLRWTSLDRDTGLRVTVTPNSCPVGRAVGMAPAFVGTSWDLAKRLRVHIDSIALAVVGMDLTQRTKNGERRA